MVEYLFTFGLTLAVEGAVAAALGFRSLRELSAILAVNLITHPAFYTFTLWYSADTGPLQYLLGLPFFEILVFAVEAALLKCALPERGWMKVSAVSLLANAGSFLAGIVLLWS